MNNNNEVLEMEVVTEPVEVLENVEVVTGEESNDVLKGAALAAIVIGVGYGAKKLWEKHKAKKQAKVSEAPVENVEAEVVEPVKNEEV